MDNFTGNAAVADFVDKLIEEKGFLDLTSEVREEIKNDLLTRLDDFIAARVIAALSDDDVNSFSDMLEKNTTEEEIQQFVTTHVPNFEQFMTNTLMEFKDVYLGTTPPPAAV